MQAILIFLVGAIAVGSWSASGNRQVPKVVIAGMGVLVAMALYSRGWV